MEAELIIVSGPLPGARFALGAAPLDIGRAPECAIHLPIPEASPHHCTIQPESGRYLLVDRRSALGTYVNGLREQRHPLEDGDQIGIGDVVILFRANAGAEAAPPTHTVLLRACSLLFLFRALAGAGDRQHALIEAQLLRLLADLLPVENGAVVLGGTESEVAASARASAALAPLAARVSVEGPVVDEPTRMIVVPLYVRGRLRGMLGLRFTAAVQGKLETYRDTLAAVATLASASLEAMQEVERLRTENALLQERTGSDALIAGSSAAMRKLLDMVARVAPLDTSVLLLGESGTGKEVIARALHQQSPRRTHPFVAINCAAITDTLLESELFGHEKGAFTGAVAQKKGKLEAAEGGTVFLDEIGELALPLQAKLLRVLQQREFERVGGTFTVRLDVRIIAATNRDLAGEARRGAFREDLYHRLNVVALRTPPLRERREDIPELARYFLERSAARCRRRVAAISPEAERRLMQYEWPGNVRELENAIERAVVLGNSETVEADDLPETVNGSTALAPAADPLIDAKRDAILRAWSEAQGDYKSAARILGVHPNSLLRMIRTLGIRDQLRP